MAGAAGDRGVSRPRLAARSGAALPFGGCPRCRQQTLYDGVLAFAPKCRSCGLDYTQFNVGDGAAAFLTLIIGAVVSALAIWLELTFSPPFWLHVLLWVPLTTAAVIVGLRAGKARLLAAEYRRRAGEARRARS
jgi:uncharacterized protein (DUF983 family)